MRLTVLGCSGSGPGPYSAASGYLVQADDSALALDMGNGSFGVLQRHLDPFDLDALAISHLHPDHCADVSALVVHRRYHLAPPPPTGPLVTFGPSQTASRLAAAYAPSTAELATTDLSDVLDIQPFEPGQRATAAAFTLTAHAVAHPCESYGMRVEHGGRTLAYTGDSAPCDGLLEVAKAADVLLAEASWTHRPGRPPGLHMSGRQAGELAAQAEVGRLLLTHVASWTDREEVLAEARSGYRGPVELVDPDRHYEI